MRKINILVLSYSQTGRTTNILDMFLEPLRSRSFVQVEVVNIEPEIPFPYPWPKLYFFSIMPETVFESSIRLKDFTLRKDVKYDFIVLGCQVWFLSPSLPISSLLRHPESSVFDGVPVITVLTCRKMWSEAMDALDRKLTAMNSRIIDKIVVTVEGTQMQTLHRTRDNLFIPRRDERLEKQGTTWKTSDEEIASVRQKGHLFARFLESYRSNPAAPLVTELSPAMKDYRAYHLERIAKNSFMGWGRFMKKYSDPKSRSRYVFTTIFSAVFLVRIFIGLPLIEGVSKIKSLMQRRSALHAAAFDQPVERGKD